MIYIYIVPSIRRLVGYEARSESESDGEVVEACGSVESGDHDLKEMLMRKYSGYVSKLRKELLKKRKKGKLPKDAISALLEWWNTHYRWPYPTVIQFYLYILNYYVLYHIYLYIGRREKQAVGDDWA